MRSPSGTSALQALVLAVAPLVVAAAEVSAALRAASASTAAAYDAFRLQFRQRHRHQGADTVDIATRRQLFARRRAEVEAHNARRDSSWIAEVNRFADFTDDELRAMYGYDRAGRVPRSGSAAASSLLEAGLADAALAESVDFRESLVSSKFVREQSMCGSCWAVATAGAIEMQAEIDAKGPAADKSSFLQGGRSRVPPMLSFEQLVDCVNNTRHCGGDGGCKGATGELALEYVQAHGLAEKDGYSDGYLSEHPDHKCKTPLPSASIVQIGGWSRLPTNKLAPLMQRVNHGPVVVSVAAEGWQSYSKGVFASCKQDTIVNHAVVLMGYGRDQDLGLDYWIIRNSWGESWGEGGIIRLQRHASDEGDAGFCGTDDNSREGVGCDGDPMVIPICGMCGVLSDSSFPTGVVLKGRV